MNWVEPASSLHCVRADCKWLKKLTLKVFSKTCLLKAHDFEPREEVDVSVSFRRPSVSSLMLFLRAASFF